MSLFSKIGKLARSPQGKKALDQAQSFAKSPEGKKRIASVRDRVGPAKKKKR